MTKEMTKEEMAALMPVLAFIDRYLPTIHRTRADRTPRPIEEIKAEMWALMRHTARKHDRSTN